MRVAWAVVARAVWAVVVADIHSGCSEARGVEAAGALAEGRAFSAAGAGAWVAVAVSSAVEAVA